MWVSKNDIAANLAAFQAIQRAVDHRARIMHEVNQIIGTTRHVEINRVTRIDSEVTEGVEAGLATHRCGGDISVSAADGDNGIGLPATASVQRNIIGQAPSRQQPRRQHERRKRVLG